MKEHATDAVLATPPVAAGGLILWGTSLSDWVMILTAVYTLSLIVSKLPAVIDSLRVFVKWLKERHE